MARYNELKRGVCVLSLPKGARPGRIQKDAERVRESERGSDRNLSRVRKTILHHLMTGKIRVKDLPV
jgi:hypothetical protein